MKLENAVPWGRNLNEYTKMFALSDKDLSAKILACADGPSSFNQELTQKKGNVTSIDPIYQFSTIDINHRIDETASSIIEHLEKEKDNYLWNSIPDIDQLKKIRMQAMHSFLQDYEKGKQEKRYRFASLPTLPFKNKEFELVICSHFLFLYSEHLDFDFHLQAILEMLRVGKEVRIFPLVDLEAKASHHLDPLIKVLEEKGYKTAIEKVDYEFQKGGNHVLKIS